MSWYRAGHLIEQLERRHLLSAAAADQGLATATELDEPIDGGGLRELDDCGELAPCAAIHGVVMRDIAGDGFSSDDEPQGGVDVELFADDGDGRFDPAADTLLDTTTSDAVSGEYRFEPVASGRYFVRQIVPDGFVQTVGPDHYALLVQGVNVLTVDEQAIDDFRQPDPAGSLFVTALDDDPALLKQKELTGVVGGERDVLLDVKGLATKLSASIVVGREGERGAMSFASATPGASVTIQYDGADDDVSEPLAALSNAQGLTHDLTSAGASSGLLLAFERIDAGALTALDVEIHLTSGETQAIFTGQITESADAMAVFIEYADFNADEGFSFTDVDSIQLVFNQQRVDNVDFTLILVTTAALADDDLDFGNHRPAPQGAIRGTKFSDENANGVRDAVGQGDETGLEPGLEGFEIYLDLNNNMMRDDDEPREVTGPDGRYEFTDVDPGSYVVREVLREGFLQTRPGPPDFGIAVEIIDGETVDNVDFGNVALPVVSIGDALRVVEGQPSVFTVTLNRPAVVPIELTFETVNGTALAGEDYVAQSDTIMIPVHATSFTITIDTIDDLVNEPPEEFFTVRLVSATGATIDPTDDEGRAIIDDDDDPLGAIEGRKWLDVDGDGQQDEGEPGLEGVTIYLDDNNNGRLEDEELSTLTDSAGNYHFDNLTPDTYVVRELVPQGFRQTFPAGATGGAHTIEVVGGETTSNVDFGNRAFELGAITGRKWLDDNADGQQDEGEPGIPGVTIYLDANNNAQFDNEERSTLTDSAGNYRFEDLSPATYVVRELVPQGFNQTFPAGESGGAHTVEVNADQTTGNVDFGNRAPGPGTIKGHVFADQDGDGVQDAAEQGLPGVTVYLDTNGNGRLDEGERATTTNAQGGYEFDNLDPGTYVVRHVGPPASVETLPGFDGQFSHTVTVSADEVITDVDFGDRFTRIDVSDPPEMPPPETDPPVNPPPEGGAGAAAGRVGAIRRQTLSRDGGGGMPAPDDILDLVVGELTEVSFIDPAIEEALDELLVVLSDPSAPDLLGIDPGDPPRGRKGPDDVPLIGILQLPDSPAVPLVGAVATGGFRWWYAALASALVGGVLAWYYRAWLIRRIKLLLP